MVGTVKLQPVKELFAGKQVVDKFLQQLIVIDPVLKWRGPGPLSYTQTKIFGCLCQFTNSETTLYQPVESLRELVLHTISQTTLFVRYDQWFDIIRKNKIFLELKECDYHYEVETVALGTDLENVLDADVAHILNLTKEFTLHDMKQIAEEAFYTARGRICSFQTFWDECKQRTKQK